MADPLDYSVTQALHAWRVQHAAGVGVSDALCTSASLCSTQANKACFIDASARAARGESIEQLTQALAPLLTESDRATLIAGWNAGRAEATMDAVIAQRQLWYQARQRVRAQMLMPAAVLLMAAFVAPLPALIAGGDLVAYAFGVGAPIIIGLLVWKAVAWLLFSVRRSSGVTFVDRQKLRLPLLSAVERDRCLAETSSCLGALLSSGIPVTTALETTARAASNGLFRVALLKCRQAIVGGKSLSEALRQDTLWPAEFQAALDVGERSGKLDETLARLGNSYREAYVRSIGLLMEWVPRLL